MSVTARRRLARLSTAAAATASVVAFGVASASPAHAAPLREGGILDAVARFVAAPDRTDGANDFNCKTTAAHPYPVILVHGTFVNQGVNFVKAGPRLKNAGYCTFAMNYGQTSISFGRVGGLDHITNSAQQLDAFITKVMKATGAKKVDIVGHSQGGNVPMWWIKKMGGAAKTAHYVGWAPSSRGTTLDGIATLSKNLKLLGIATGLADLGQFPGVLDQTTYSDHTNALFPNNSSDVPDGPKYTVIATNQDRVVTPYTTQTLSGKDVNNVVLQDKCPKDKAGHIGLLNDDPTMQLTTNALADGPKNFQPKCTGYGLALL